MAKGLADLLAVNDKFGLLAFNTTAADIGDDMLQLADDLWVATKPVISFHDDWKKWIGSVRQGALEDCDLFIISKQPSRTAAILDAENVSLRTRVWRVFRALLLTGRIACYPRPFLISGANVDGHIEIRQSGDLDGCHHYVGQLPDFVGVQHLRLALELDKGVGEWHATGKFKRLSRVFGIYMKARSTEDILDRVHEYCRCIEGFILPKVGRTEAQFKSRTELFIGPGRHDLMGEAFAIRSAVEHLNEELITHEAGRAERLGVLKQDYILEYIVRRCLRHLLLARSLWEHFIDDATLADFWAKTVDERRALWGAPFDPYEALAEFKEDWVRDIDLGL